MEQLIFIFSLSWLIAYGLILCIRKFATLYKSEMLAFTKAVFVLPTVGIGHGIVPVPAWYPIYNISNFDNVTVSISVVVMVLGFLYFWLTGRPRR
ncbi:hypothetical protein EYS14_00780 [Alteromonadaceae bacterium M269]|nr:hypothetical protein EYS14_00780 [Alteromonadaceae bacterium M269]